jgi:hypothetical protein
MAFLRGEILAAMLAAAAAAGDTTGAAGSGAGGPAEQVERILKDGGYQRSLPKDPPPLSDFSFSLGPLETLVRILIWTGLAVVVALAISWLVTRLRGRARDVAVEEGSAAAPLDVPLDSAERLAAAGRFAEAIHALLLETLAALSRAAQLAPSLTSREIVARVPLPERARDALVGLVLAVEISRFGGAPAGERDYRACLERFHAFLETYRRGSPRTEGAAA